MKKVFLTGATSPIGVHILRLLLLEKSTEISVLLRGVDEKDAESRLTAMIKRFDNYDRNFERLAEVRVILGDLTTDYCGINLDQYEYLKDSIVEIFHCAALTNFNESLENLRSVNVEGTRNVLELAKSCKYLKKINYISSIFVSGSSSDSFSEDDLDTGQVFHNYYEQSKFEAELILRECITNGFTIATYRLSVVTGEWDGQMTHFHGLFYQFIRLLTLRIFDQLPIAMNCKINLIPCDIAAEAIYMLSNNCDRTSTYHVISKNGISLRYLVSLISQYFECNYPQCVGMEEFNLSRLDVVHKKILMPFLPYFNSQVILCSDKTIRELQKSNFRFPEINEKYIIKILEFWEKLGYFKSLDWRR